MKNLRFLFVALLLVQSLFSPAQVARLVKFTTSPTGVVAAWRQKVAGVDVGPSSWERITTVQGLNLQARGAAIAKPVSKAFPTAYSTLDFSLYKDISNWPNGFTPGIFYTRTDVPLATQLRYVRLMEAGQGWTAEQQADQSLKSRQYYDVPAGTFGAYEQWYNLVDASVQTVLNHLSVNLNGNAIGAARVVYNWENYPPQTITSYNNPSSDYNQRGVLQFWPDAGSRTWVCELPELLGQSKTIQWLWDNGKFAGELAQRMVNRHVAVLKWTKAKCGSGTLVVNGDGNQVFFNGNVRYIDDYAALYNSNGSTYSPGFMSTGANFGSVSAGGVTISGGGSRFWDVQDYCNNYSYVGQGYLQPADFDELVNNKRSYEWFWSKVEPGPGSDDINIPTGIVLNRRMAAKYGRPTLPIVWQGHNRWEFGILKKGTQQKEDFFNPRFDGSVPAGGLGGDGAIMPDFITRTYAVVAAMAGINPGDGMMMWTTHKRVGPGASTQANAWSNRPLNDWMGLFSGLALDYQFKEYFDPARNPKYLSIDEVYTKYTNGISGGDWGSNMRTDGGDGYWKRGAGVIANHQNPSDPRSTCGIQARVISKTINGTPVKWAMIVATNHRQGRTDLSTFNVRFKASDVGSTTDLDVTGLSVSGWEPTVVEVCLEPSKMTIPTLTSIGSTSGGSSPPTSTTFAPSTGSDKFFGFNFQPIANSTQPGASATTYLGNSLRIVRTETARIRVDRSLDVGGAITGIYEKVNGNWTPNYVNNHDKGRQVVLGFWSGPYPFNPVQIVNGSNLFRKPGDDHPFSRMQWNPNEAGNWTGQGGTITHYGYEASTQTHYIRSRMINFPTENYETGLYVERWQRPVGENIVRNWFKVTWNRADEPVPYLNRWPADGTGEMPTIYGNMAAAYQGVYAGANGTIVRRDMRNNTNVYAATRTSEPWMGFVNGSDRGVGFTGPDIWYPQIDVHGDEEGAQYNSATETSGLAMYMTNLIARNMNSTGSLLYMYDVVVGTVDDFRSAAQLHPASNPANNVPNWNFANGSWNGFRAFNGLLSEEGTGNALVVDLLRNNANIVCPTTLFQAADLPTLYVRVKNELDADGLTLTWGKPGQNDGQTGGQEVNFTCPRNGQFNTIAIPLTGVTNWNGQISTISIKRARIGEENTETNVEGLGRKLSFTYIGKNNPN